MNTLFLQRRRASPIIRLLSLALVLLTASPIAVANAASPFRLETIVGAFEQMRSTLGFDVSRPLQWGHFFVASSSEPLRTIRSRLEASGYIYVEEHRDEKGNHWLQMAKIEVHTPESLHKRNQDLYAFASQFKGVVYDGWDVTRR